jgi:hypothetical protein
VLYLFDIADSLGRVLKHAGSLAPHRLAGYAANGEFWLGEVEHCFAVLDGYQKRFYSMRHATTAYSSQHPVDSERSDGDTATTNKVKDFELRA